MPMCLIKCSLFPFHSFSTLFQSTTCTSLLFIHFTHYFKHHTARVFRTSYTCFYPTLLMQVCFIFSTAYYPLANASIIECLLLEKEIIIDNLFPKKKKHRNKKESKVRWWADKKAKRLRHNKKEKKATLSKFFSFLAFGTYSVSFWLFCLTTSLTAFFFFCFFLCKNICWVSPHQRTKQVTL